MKDIFSYVDYREFLKEYYLREKEHTTSFSYQVFSKKAGIRSANYLKLVTDGDRDLSVATIHKFAKALGLNYTETSYFEAMVHSDQAPDRSVRKFYERRMMDLRRKRAPRKHRSNSLKKLLTKWYYPAVLVALDGLNVSLALIKLPDRLGLSKSDVGEAIEVLLSNRLISIVDDTYQLPEDYGIIQGRKFEGIVKKEYLRSHAERTLDVFEKTYNRGGQFITHTFTIEKDEFVHFSELVYDFLDSLTRRSNEQHPDEVVQLNIQMYELSSL